MDNKQVIERATKIKGSIGKLAIAMEWDKGSIAAVKAGKNPMPPERAAQIAEILGEDSAKAYFEAAKVQAKSPTAKATIERVAKSVGVAAVGAAFFLATVIQPNQAGCSKSDIKGQNIQCVFLLMKIMKKLRGLVSRFHPFRLLPVMPRKQIFPVVHKLF